MGCPLEQGAVFPGGCGPGSPTTTTTWGRWVPGEEKLEASGLE